MPGRLITLSPRVSTAHLLLWDEICVLGLERKLELLDQPEQADVLYLIANDVVEALPGTEYELSAWAKSHGQELPIDTLGSVLHFKASLSMSSDGLSVQLPSVQETLLGFGYPRLIAELDNRRGLDSVALGEDFEVGGRPVITWREQFLGKPLPESLVWEVLVREMPVPAEGVPLERILDFRQQDMTRVLASRLRHWIAAVASSENSAAQLGAEIKDLRNEYSAHIRRHQLEQDSTVLTALVTGFADVAENAVRLKFGNAVRAAFALRTRRAKLFDAEQSAPGREIAYLERVSEVFGPSPRKRRG